MKIKSNKKYLELKVEYSDGLYIHDGLLLLSKILAIMFIILYPISSWFLDGSETRDAIKEFWKCNYCWRRDRF